MKLDGSVAVVTGGARGIGKAITKSLLQNKSKVYFVDVNVNEGKNTQKEFEDEFGQGKATFLECDVTDKDKMEEILSRVVKENGQLDIVCNNAGIGFTDDIEKLISINLTAVIRGTLLGVKYMDKNNGGRGGCIVNMASIAGLTYTPPGNTNCAYYAAKHGVVGFTRTFAKVAIESGVRVNCICPGGVDTELLKEVAKEYPIVQKVVEKTGVLTVDDVAEGLIQLLNDEEKVGEAMRIKVENGIDYYPFSKEEVPL